MSKTVIDVKTKGGSVSIELRDGKGSVFASFLEDDFNGEWDENKINVLDWEDVACKLTELNPNEKTVKVPMVESAKILVNVAIQDLTQKSLLRIDLLQFLNVKFDRFVPISPNSFYNCVKKGKGDFFADAYSKEVENYYPDSFFNLSDLLDGDAPVELKQALRANNYLSVYQMSVLEVIKYGIRNNFQYS